MRCIFDFKVNVDGEVYDVSLFVDEFTLSYEGAQIEHNGELVFDDTVPPVINKLDKNVLEKIFDKIDKVLEEKLVLLRK